MRRVARRAKQVSQFRRERVVVEVPAEAATVDETDGAADDVEKIEVHVHLHRGTDSGAAGVQRKRRSRPMLTGVLFDWQGHYDKILTRPSHSAPKRWSRSAKCRSCEAIIPSAARHCPRCAAPRPRRMLAKVFALIGLGSFAAVFALSAHLLGSSVPEHKPPSPLRSWSDNEDIIVVEVPVTPSPFAAEPPTAYYGSGSAANVAAR